MSERTPSSNEPTKANTPQGETPPPWTATFRGVYDPYTEFPFFREIKEDVVLRTLARCAGVRFTPLQPAGQRTA